MSAAEIGYSFGVFVIIGLLPAAFIAYGRSNNRSWATVAGVAFAMLGIGGNIVNGNVFTPGGIAGVALVAWALFRKINRTPPPPP